MKYSSLFFSFRVINEKDEEIELFSSVECKVGYWVLTYVQERMPTVNLDFRV